MASNTKKKPVKKAKAGRFQVTTWKFHRFLNSGDKAYIERACIQYSTFNRVTRTWEKQSIWCSAGDLSRLAEALEEIRGGDPSSFRRRDAGGFSLHSEENPLAR